MCAFQEILWKVFFNGSLCAAVHAIRSNHWLHSDAYHSSDHCHRYFCGWSMAKWKEKKNHSTAHEVFGTCPFF